MQSSLGSGTADNLTYGVNSSFNNGGQALDLEDDGHADGPTDGSCTPDSTLPNGGLARPTLDSVVFDPIGGSVQLFGTACPSVEVTVYQGVAEPDGEVEPMEYLGQSTAAVGGTWNLGLVQSVTGTERYAVNAIDGLRSSEFATRCLDSDGDGFPSAVCGGADCDDGDATSYPGAPEVCDGVDSNCDGALTIVESTWEAPVEHVSQYGGGGAALNVYEVADPVVVGEVEFYFQEFTADTQWAAIYSRPGDATTWTLAASAQLPPATNTPGWLSSGPLNVTMTPGLQWGIGFTTTNTISGFGQDNPPAADPPWGTLIGYEQDVGAPSPPGSSLDTDPCCSTLIAPRVTTVAGVEEEDGDGDGVFVCGGDCDDASADVFPGADEGCDGIDTDCDGSPDASETVDGDGDGFVLCADCEDGEPTVWPGALEDCSDGFDTDCDGVDDTDEPACAGDDDDSTAADDDDSTAADDDDSVGDDDDSTAADDDDSVGDDDDTAPDDDDTAPDDDDSAPDDDDSGEDDDDSGEDDDDSGADDDDATTADDDDSSAQAEVWTGGGCRDCRSDHASTAAAPLWGLLLLLLAVRRRRDRTELPRDMPVLPLFLVRTPASAQEAIPR